MNDAAPVVTKRVGSRIRSAKPTAAALKRRAPSTPTRTAARMEKTKTVRVTRKKRKRAGVERARLERRKAWEAGRFSLDSKEKEKEKRG